MDRKALIDLIDRATVLPRRVQDELVPDRVATTVAALLVLRLQSKQPNAMEAIARLEDLPNRLLLHIPPRIPDFADAVGLESTNVYDGLDFARETFFEAAARAFSEGQATVNDRGGLKHTLRFAEVEQGRRTVAIDGYPPIRDARILVADKTVSVADAIRAVTTADSDAGERQSLATRLEPLSITERIAIIDEHMRRGLSVLYGELGARFARLQSVSPDMFMPPSMDRMAGWMRLPRAGLVDFDVSAQALLDELGLEAALRRFSALPRALPKLLMDQVRTLPFRQRRSMVVRLLNHAITPLANAHCLVLAAIVLEGRPHRDRALFELWERFGNIHDTVGDLHIGIARWVANELSRSPIARKWPTATVLGVAWSHAQELLRLFARGQLTVSYISRINGQLYPYEEKLTGTRARYEAAHPQNTIVQGFFTAMIAYAIRAGVPIDEPRRVALLSRIMNFNDEGKPTGLEMPLLFRADSLADSLDSFVSAPSDEMIEEAFAGIFVEGWVARWRAAYDAGADAPEHWSFLIFVHGDTPIAEGPDRDAVLREARRLHESPVKWDSMSDVARFVVCVQQAVALDDQLALESARRAWDLEINRVRRESAVETRRAALEVLRESAVDLSHDEDPATATTALAGRLATLRSAFVPETETIDRAVLTIRPRLPSNVAGVFDDLAIAARTR